MLLGHRKVYLSSINNMKRQKNYSTKSNRNIVAVEIVFTESHGRNATSISTEDQIKAKVNAQ